MNGLHEDLIDLLKQHGAAKLLIRLYRAMEDDQDMRETSSIEKKCLNWSRQVAELAEMALAEEAEEKAEQEKKENKRRR